MHNPTQYIVRPTTDEEFRDRMPYLTSSLAEAVNTCPRWGIIHSVHGKRFVSGYRQMALEAGSLMHDVFAVLNLLQVGLHQGYQDHMHVNGQLLFPNDRWDNIWRELSIKDKSPSLENINSLELAIFACIATSEFFDDPNDRNRTVSNLENCALELLQYYLLNLIDFPIYISDPKNPEAPIGIEMSLDAVFEIEAPLLDEFGVDRGPILKLIRAIGLADVLYQNPDTKAITLGEYKTASQMNDAWRMAFDTRHQITLYNALLQAYFGKQENFNTILVGSAIPVRATSVPVQHFQVDRDQGNIDELLNTYAFTQFIIDEYYDQPLQAPMFTHSCNRYFRPCSLLDLCTADKNDQYVMFDTMETVFMPSPSEQKALLRNM